ncbi:AAA family ATPase [Bradyrhizobium iriomotense]|uniref:AAA+ ATPase domain-containing protein n=1 Tax=Bradyrhizobium iriomotense TaxID=441950 RepID=A0ABQ6B5T2_9BRAD|nr:AAA family ATPase [Bradyrhizobium iriomotense]GLR89759.1 hypothetical protein GCM10007857_64730 [Bradyrhizobium iriomotense]
MSWPSGLRRFGRWVLLFAFISLASVTAYFLFFARATSSVPITEIVKVINSGEVIQLTIADETIAATVRDGRVFTAQTDTVAGALNMMAALGVDQERIKSIAAVSIRAPSHFGVTVLNAIGVLVLLAMVFGSLATGLSVVRRKASDRALAAAEASRRTESDISPTSLAAEQPVQSETSQAEASQETGNIDEADVEPPATNQRQADAGEPPQNPPEPDKNVSDERKQHEAYFLSAHIGETDHARVYWTDVIGATDAKKALQEVADFLKSPDAYERLGARMRRGILLDGPPGTGKTLLAQALATEADAAFFPVSGSSFLELYVGVGAARIRDLFARARTETRAIIFIDEIDALGAKRGDTTFGGSQERNQALNQLLIELDGFGRAGNSLVLAATNRADTIDPALRRPGRFDRVISVLPPSREERLELIELYARGKPFDDTWTTELKEEVARDTSGMTGADIATIMNEAAIAAASSHAPAIGAEHILIAVKTIARDEG